MIKLVKITKKIVPGCFTGDFFATLELKKKRSASIEINAV